MDLYSDGTWIRMDPKEHEQVLARRASREQEKTLGHRERTIAVLRRRLPDKTIEQIQLIEEGIYREASKRAIENRIVPDFDVSVKSKEVRKLRYNTGKDYVHEVFPFKEIYRDIIWKTFNALIRHDSGKLLWERIDSGFVDLSDVGAMTHKELDPARAATLQAKCTVLKSIEVRVEKRDGKTVRIPYEISYGDDGIKYTEYPDSEIQCRCGSRKVSSYQQQTRSADEPMTIFANCLACNSRFRM